MAMAAIQNVSKEQWMKRAQSYGNSLKRIREEGKDIGERGITALLTAGAGYGVGVAMREWGDPSIPGTEIPAIPMVSGVCLAASVLGVAGSMSSAGTGLFGGALGGWAAVKGYTQK